MGSEAHDSAESRTYFDSSVWEGSTSPAHGIAHAVALGLQADEVHVTIVSDTSEVTQGRYPADRRIVTARAPLTSPISDLFSVRDDAVFFKNSLLASPLVVNDVRRARLPGNLSSTLVTMGVRSFGLFTIKRDGKIVGMVACLFKKSLHRWRSDEIRAFDTLHHALSPRVQRSPKLVKPDHTQALKNKIAQYNRIAQEGDLIILTTNSSLAITDLFGNVEGLLGVSAHELLDDPAVWAKIVAREDLPDLRRRLLRLRAEREDLQQEVRVRHQKSGETRWVLLRATPHFSPTGEFLGWEGFGVDVTEKRIADEAFLDQNRRLEALFEVARALQGYADPAAVTLTGLRALLRATQAECGYACFADRLSGTLEVVASVGLSEQYISKISAVVKGPSLLRQCVDSQTGLLVDNLQTHPAAQKELAALENLYGAIIVPMVSEGTTIAALVLFSRKVAGFRAADFELASAAASQITLAIRQAEMIDEQRRQSASLSSLYKISRELAKYRGAIDFTEAILPIIKSEFALKRAWIGRTNDQGTFLVGQAGFGPDMSHSRIRAQIELSSSHAILHAVCTQQNPVHIGNPTQSTSEPLLDLFPAAKYLFVVPMVTIGRVMGVIVVEPTSDTTFELEERSRLLVNMANEMATALMATRFESKMSEAIKMRTAGLLASGVAHNFNNLLQAIIGQVSLIDLQTQPGSPVRSATKTISDAAKRGAALVSQLLNFATKGSARKIAVTVSSFLSDSRENFATLVGKDISLTMKLEGGDHSKVSVDPAQLYEVITNILTNAKEAIDGASNGQIVISAQPAVVRSGELGPDVSPGSYTRIDIQDNGVGMSLEQQERCFEPFFTTKNRDEATGVGLNGSGLGLAAAYSIIREHDGVITVHSTPGEGAVFSIYLPMLSRRNTRDFVRSETLNELQRPHTGVLILGVESGVQPFIGKTLESLGYNCRGVFDTRHAHELLKKEATKWGVVLLDGEGLGGRCSETCETLAATHPHIHVICVCSSGHAEEEHIESANGRVHHLEKPITVWGLESALKRFRPSRVGNE